MASAVLTAAYEPTAAEFAELQALMSEIGVDHGCTPESLANAAHRDAVGLASLEVILIIAQYMERVGRDIGDFAPEWVEHLESPSGIVSVMRLIDRL